MNTKATASSVKRIGIVLAVLFVIFGFSGRGLLAQTSGDGTQQNQNTNSSDGQNVPNGDENQQTQQDITDLQNQIQQSKQQLDQLNQQKADYQKSITDTQQQAATLNTQLQSIDQQAQKTQLDIQITQTQIETLQLQIKDVNNKIKSREDDIATKKTQLAEFLRELNKAQNTGLWTLLLINNRFSDFFNQLNYLTDIEQNLKTSLDTVNHLKSDLKSIQSDLDAKQADLQDSKNKLQITQSDLAGQKDMKSQLLDETNNNEAKYQDLLAAAQQQQSNINNEIDQAEQALSAKLQNQTGGAYDDTKTLSWPVAPVNGISAYFHDPSYPFKSLLGQHSGVDIPTPLGTPIKAAASGTVGSVRDPKDVGQHYAYIMILHTDDHTATVYGHVSQVNVQIGQFVTRGQIIGLTGGVPGTPGVGYTQLASGKKIWWSTGAHLHFEVRKDGIPVNPLDYLP